MMVLQKEIIFDLKNSKSRPQSSSFAQKRSKQSISRMTTHGSCSSTRFGGKTHTIRSKESYIRKLAEHKDR